MLTKEQIAKYHRDGYVVPDFRLPPETLTSIRADHDRLVKQHPEFYNYCPTVLAYDLAFLNYVRIPQILDMVAQLIGEDFALWNSSFFAKPAHDGQATPWHQDGEYWPIRPLATCTVWIAVDAATRANGCLRLIPGSHKAKRLGQHRTNEGDNLTLNQELLNSEFNEEDAIDLVLESGQMSLHDIYIVHGSSENNSENSRRGLTLRYFPTTSVFDRKLATELAVAGNFLDHKDRTLFLMRGDDRSGQNDFRLRW